MSEVDRTDTTTIYKEGGWKPDADDENILVEYEQDYDADNNPVGEPRVIKGSMP